AAAFIVYKVGAGCPYTDIQAAVSAAAANPGEDYVWIANNKSYSGEHVLVNDQDVDIEGGFTDCDDFDIGPNDVTPVSGLNNDGGPVFEITGNSHVYLGNLVLRDASYKNGNCGGGIWFHGQGALSVGNITITENHACGGGGIYFKLLNGPASLTLL